MALLQDFLRVEGLPDGPSAFSVCMSRSSISGCPSAASAVCGTGDGTPVRGDLWGGTGEGLVEEHLFDVCFNGFALIGSNGEIGVSDTAARAAPGGRMSGGVSHPAKVTCLTSFWVSATLPRLQDRKLNITEYQPRRGENRKSPRKTTTIYVDQT